MWPNFTHLFWKAVHGMPMLVSSNWAAFGMGVGLFVLYHVLVWVIRGRDEMRRQWMENIGIGLLATVTGYLLLFAWSAVVTTYDEHNDSTGRWRAVVKEKDTLKEGLKQRDDYIAKLESAKCPQCKPGSSTPPSVPMEEKITSIEVETRTTCALNPGEEVPPERVDIMFVDTSAKMTGPGGSLALDILTPVIFKLQQDGKRVMIINKFHLSAGSGFAGRPLQALANFDMIVVPIVTVAYGDSFGRMSLAEATLTVNGKDLWYSSLSSNDQLQAGHTEVRFPLADLKKRLKQ